MKKLSIIVFAFIVAIVNTACNGADDSDAVADLQHQGNIAYENEQKDKEATFSNGQKDGLFAETPTMPTAAPPSIPTAPNSSQSVASSENSINQDDINELNKLSDPKSVPTIDKETSNAADGMDAWSESVLEEFGISSWGQHNGKIYSYASLRTSLKPLDPQYGVALVNAFDRAMMKLQEEYVRDQFGSQIVDKIKSLDSDRSTNAKDIALPAAGSADYLGKLMDTMNKGLDVENKKLDKELVELGVSPNELAQLTPKMKKEYFAEKFLKNTITQASGDISGLFPMQTKVITDSSGRTVVGVVAVISPKTKQIAKDIRLQRKSIITGKGRDIASLLPKSNKEYTGTLGVRLTYDEDGTPAIISYGMASYMPDPGDDYINDVLKSEAKDEAISNANAQITEIINGHMNVKNNRIRGEKVSKHVEREIKQGSATLEKMVENIIQITNNQAESFASAKLQGISTVKTWKYTLESGQEFFGAVRVWKYSTLQATKSFNDPNFYKNGTDKKSQSFKPFEQGSKKVNSIDDF